MFKKVAGVAVMVCLCGLLAAPAGARPKSHNVSLTFTAVALPSGSVNSAAGEIKGTLGPGAILIKGGSTGKATAYYAAGRIAAKINATVTPNPDGSQVFSGELKVTSGTGAYTGARGQLSLTGTTTTSGGVPGSLTGQAKGAITYGR
jgi:hypothetical protein